MSHFLPHELFIHIIEFNPLHRPKWNQVLDELVKLYFRKVEFYKACSNCMEPFVEEPNFKKFILFRKFTFCSEICGAEFEDHYRRSYREWLKRNLERRRRDKTYVPETRAFLCHHN